MNTCAGCGKENLSRSESVELTIAPEIKVWLCRNRQTTSGYYPRDTCLDKATNALRPCPGCGETMTVGRWRQLHICQMCLAAIERQRAEKPPSPLRWVGIVVSDLVDDSGWRTEHEELCKQILGMLEVCLADSIGRWRDAIWA